MSAATLTETLPNGLKGFVPVQVRALRTTKTDAADLFVQYESQAAPVLYCRAGSRPEDQQFAELAEGGIESLYVRSDDFSSLSNDVLSSLETLLQDDGVRRADKFAALQIAVAVTLEQSLRLIDCSKFLAIAQNIGDDIVALLGAGDVVPRELFRLARHDFTAFAHVTNVASYCVMLANEMGICDENELRKIAVGAILHDLGKRFIPSRILTKAANLTPEEREIVESHPRRGYAELVEAGGLEFGQLMMVYQHHERIDGTGYPVQVRENEIHPWAKMLAVVDVFDTMTARRAAGRPAAIEEVLAYLRQQAGTHFDNEVVECWISAMTKT